MTQKQVPEICFAVGFNDLPHFIRVFTSTYGVSPTKFRKT
ncbi:MAG: helix-turn-helix domain-containing protein [Muribaculaceae bacterium]|nr:helix-turn-helix domain-containing protein [Muribaculaceae bacterium]